MTKVECDQLKIDCLAEFVEQFKADAARKAIYLSREKYEEIFKRARDLFHEEKSQQFFYGGSLETSEAPADSPELPPDRKYLRITR